MEKLRQVQWVSQGYPVSKCQDKKPGPTTSDAKSPNSKGCPRLVEPRKEKNCWFVLHFGMKAQIQWFHIVLNEYLFPDFFFFCLFHFFNRLCSKGGQRFGDNIPRGRAKIRAVEMIWVSSASRDRCHLLTSFCLEKRRTPNLCETEKC